MERSSRSRAYRFICYRCNQVTVDKLMSLYFDNSIRYFCMTFEEDKVCPVMKGLIYFKNQRCFSSVVREMVPGIEIVTERNALRCIENLERFGDFREFGERPTGEVGLFTHRMKKKVE